MGPHYEYLHILVAFLSGWKLYTSILLKEDEEHNWHNELAYIVEYSGIWPICCIVSVFFWSSKFGMHPANKNISLSHIFFLLSLDVFRENGIAKLSQRVWQIKTKFKITNELCDS